MKHIVESERSRGTKGKSDIWAIPGRPTRAVVDLDAIAGNVRVFREIVTPGTALMAVVKADGYGHGAVMVARTALEAGATWLGVATVDEALTLRSEGIDASVLVLGPIETSEIDRSVLARLDLTVADMDFLGALRRRMQRVVLDRPVGVHVKVDTGMRRFGTSSTEAVLLCREIRDDPRLQLNGVYTHFADADGRTESFTLSQAGALDALLNRLDEQGIRPLVAHASNSAATLRWRRYDYNMVRVGIAMYGLPPTRGMRLPERIRPALEIRSRLARVSELESGDSVSYGRTYVARTPERIGLVPIGYADGYRRALSNRGRMGLAGATTHVRGRVCMDQTIVGIPDGAEARRGDEVVVIGRGGDGAPTVDEIAEQLGTISYEVVTGIARRVPRIYIKNGRAAAVQDLRSVRILEEHDTTNGE